MGRPDLAHSTWRTASRGLYITPLGISRNDLNDGGCYLYLGGHTPVVIIPGPVFMFSLFCRAAWYSSVYFKYDADFSRCRMGGGNRAYRPGIEYSCALMSGSCASYGGGITSTLAGGVLRWAAIL
ncbi:hypothetical protein D3C77_450500 [compost metagenome]